MMFVLNNLKVVSYLLFIVSAVGLYVYQSHKIDVQEKEIKRVKLNKKIMEENSKSELFHEINLIHKEGVDAVLNDDDVIEPNTTLRL